MAGGIADISVKMADSIIRHLGPGHYGEQLSDPQARPHAAKEIAGQTFTTPPPNPPAVGIHGHNDPVCKAALNVREDSSALRPTGRSLPRRLQVILSPSPALPRRLPLPPPHTPWRHMHRDPFRSSLKRKLKCFSSAAGCPVDRRADFTTLHHPYCFGFIS